MLNEIEEFTAYTGRLKYKSSGRSDLSYLGRFTFEMLKTFEGLQRVLTIIARGYLHSCGDPYDNVDLARRALCAWCSLPGKNPEGKENKWKFRTNFGEYHNEFPELVSKDGRGWFYRHVHKVIAFVKRKGDDVSKSAKNSAEILKDGFDDAWRNKVKQMQYPLFAEKTKATWLLLFENIIGDALIQGELKDRTFSLSTDQQEKICAVLPKGLKYETVVPVIAYCIANKPEDSDWTVLPNSNFDAYFGSTNFSHRLLNMFPESLLVREKDSLGVCRGRVIV
ncbi:MAG: hypothetical protein IJ555_08100 [Ruminococcus sp.]|nr:hypothetical protein [Ruminococcus sp.]MBR1739048.1 hypothetical protein [Ruminococcus sp.]